MTTVTAALIRSGRTIPLLLVTLSLAFYLVVAVAVGQASQLTGDGLAGLLERMVGLGIVSIGQTFVILVTSIDLSVANLISIAAVLASWIMDGDPDRVALAVVAVTAIGALVGFVNGILVARVGISPFIATLGVNLVLQGVISAAFNNFAGRVPHGFQRFAYGTVAGVPISLLTLLLIAGLGWFVLRRTVFGAHLYAVGGSREGARLAGIRTDRTIIGAHVICSLTAVLTGLYLDSRLGAGAPWVGRDGVYDLESVAVVVIGGTVLSGGRGGVAGTMGGVLFFAVLDAVFNMTQTDAFLKQVFRGIIVVGVVGFYATRRREHVA